MKVGKKETVNSERKQLTKLESIKDWMKMHMQKMKKK